MAILQSSIRILCFVFLNRCLVQASMSVGVQNNGHSEAIFRTYSGGGTLLGHINESFSVSSLLECGLNCVRLLPVCKSFNYKEMEDDLNMCEVNSIGKDSTEVDDFVEDENSTYGEPLDIAEKKDLVESKEKCVSAHPKKDFFSSVILKANNTLISQIETWLNNKTRWRRCYRATQHGWAAADFHFSCDGKAPTVIIVEVEDYIFGGYADISWGGQSGYKESENCFLFSLRNKDNLEPFISKIFQAKEEAIYLNPLLGPTFGGGHDLNIANNANTQFSTSNIGFTYELPSSQYTQGSPEARALLGGSSSFLSTEIEVYYLDK